MVSEITEQRFAYLLAESGADGIRQIDLLRWLSESRRMYASEAYPVEVRLRNIELALLALSARTDAAAGVEIREALVKHP